MSARTFLAMMSLIWLAPLMATAWAEEKHALREKIEVGDVCRFEMGMELQGDIQLKSSDKIVTLKLQASAKHQFPERVLGVDGEGLPARVVRYYDEATANINVSGSATTRKLRDDRRFMVAQRLSDAMVTYSPAGTLTREELELTGEHLDVTALPGLLPKDKVAVGERWDIPVPAVQQLTGLDGIVNHEVRGKLESIKDEKARISVAGQVSGIADGAEVKTRIEAVCFFDMKVQRLTQVEWKQTEERMTGPASPAVKSQSTTTVKRSFIPEAQLLGDAVVKNLPATPDPGLLLLEYRDAKGRYQFLFERSWRLVAENEHFVVFRLLDRGELVAQLNGTPKSKARPGQHLAPEELRKQVAEAAGFRQEKVLQSGEIPDRDGRWVFRHSVLGQAGDIKLQQIHYAIAGPEGDQVVLAITTEVAQVEKLGARDLAIVGTVSFPDSKGKPK